MKVYVTTVDTAGGLLTKVHAYESCRDVWLENFLWKAYRLHRNVDADKTRLGGSWPLFTPEGEDPIKFMLSKLDWYTVERSTCEVE